MQPEIKPYVDIGYAIAQRALLSDDRQEIYEWAINALQALHRRGEVDNATLEWQPSFDLYDSIIEQREIDAANPNPNRKMIDWPWMSWNKLVAPMEPGLLAIIAAADGQGKTIYAEMIAEHWAQRRNHVVFVHFELNRAIMLDRRAARHTSMTLRELRSGRYTQEQRQRINNVRPRLSAWDGYITYLHTPGWTIDQLSSKLRELKTAGQCDCVVIDYLEKIGSSQRQLREFGTNTFQREADNVEQLKSLGEATEIPILMLAQYSKGGKRTNANDIDRTAIRGAGEKTEKSNVVVLLKRERQDDGYSNLVDVRVDKNTLGPTGMLSQVMEPEYFRVIDTIGETE